MGIAQSRITFVTNPSTSKITMPKPSKAFFHPRAPPADRLVQHVEALTHRVEPLVHRVVQRVKFPIDAAEPRVLDDHSFGGSLSGRFIRTDLAAEGII